MPPTRSDARAARQALFVAVYTALWLVLFDVWIGFATRMPEDPTVQPSVLQRYFDYGRSVEGKLRDMVKATREASAPVSIVGWLDPHDAVDTKTDPSSPDHVLIAAYGQSFTGQLLRAVSAIEPRFEVRLLGGPAAPLSHSFATYRMDRGRQRAQVVVLGLLASTMPKLASLTNMSVGFESVQPFTYPRFLLRDGELEAVESSVSSFEDLQAIVADRSRMERFIGELERYDAGYESLVFRQDWLDASSLGRALRRGVGQKHARDFRGRFLDAHGFTNDFQVLDIAKAILSAFASEVRRDGLLPYVLLIHDSGFDDYLHRALAPHLARLDLPYFSTHEGAPSLQPALFLKDGHFRADVNAALAADLAISLRRAGALAGSGRP